MVTVMTYMRFWHGGLNFSDGYLRYPADEEQEEGKEEPEASQEHQTIPDGWREISPTGWQEVPAQRGDGDNETLEPHADVYEDRYNPHDPHVGS